MKIILQFLLWDALLLHLILCAMFNDNIQPKNLTITIQLYREDASDTVENVSFLFNVADHNLDFVVFQFCLHHHIPDLICNQLFDQVTKVRYDYLEQEMLKSEFTSGKSIINTQFIPNPHLLRSSFAINKEINNHFKKKSHSVDYERLLSPISFSLYDMIGSELVGTVHSLRTKTFVNVAFIHSCSIEGENSRVLTEMVDIIISSRLIDSLDYLLIFNYGMPLSMDSDTTTSNSSDKSLISFRRDYSSKLLVVEVSEDTSYFEVPTIRIMQEFVKLFHLSYPMNHYQINLLYLHTKGVSYREIYPQIEDWRHFMMYFLVEQHKKCLNLLYSEQFDALGVNYKTNPRDFRGNFWWTTSNYLSQFSVVPLHGSNKYTAETFLGKQRFFRVYSFHESNVDHHYQRYERYLYVYKETDDDNFQQYSGSSGVADSYSSSSYSSLCKGGKMFSSEYS
jgi:hypothetical protein